MLLKAIKFCETKHQGQVRKGSGKPYATHPIIASYLLAKYKQSHRMEELLVAMLLHDTLEDTETSFLEIAEEFTPLVASLVLELTSCEDTIAKVGKNEYLKTKMLGMSSWGLVLKLVDRLSNIMDNPSEKYLKDTDELMYYLKSNRKLTKTQECIVNDIYAVIFKNQKSNKE